MDLSAREAPAWGDGTDDVMTTPPLISYKHKESELMSSEPSQPTYSHEMFGLILGWWSKLHGVTENEGGHAPNLRGELAELRRCHDLHTVIMSRGYQRLRQALTKHDYAHEQLAAIALVLAHVKVHDAEAGSFGRTCGMCEAEQKPPVSEARFQRLIRMTERSDASEAIRRMLPLVSQRASVSLLAKDLYFWNETTRRRWVSDYYDAAQIL